MLRTITINVVLTMMVLALNSQTSMAQSHQPGYNHPKSERFTERKKHYNPFTKLLRLIRNAEIYECLLGHPHFIKLQDMAQRVWEKQTGNKRRVVTWSRRNIISPGDLSVRAPYH